MIKQIEYDFEYLYPSENWNSAKPNLGLFGYNFNV